MAAAALHRILDVVRASGCVQLAETSDADLVRLFAEQGDQSAFAALVRRHGEMVWGVCFRSLRHRQDAEDAFQATFMVLARKASSLRRPNLLANWLFGVARRTSLRAWHIAEKRKQREKQLAALPVPAFGQSDAWTEQAQCIEEEVASHSDKYRVAVVLCDLEGRTGKEAAKELGIPEGTLSTRLRKARSMLARQLSRRGIVLTGTVLSMLNSAGPLEAGAPMWLASMTAELISALSGGNVAVAPALSGNAMTLANSVIARMLVAKCKAVAGAILLASFAVIGIGVLYVAFCNAPRAGAEPPLSNARPADLPRPVQKQGEGQPDAAQVAPEKSRGDRREVYSVADLVVPFEGMDRPDGRKGQLPTKEEWLMQKVREAIAPASWKNAAGEGTMEFQPLGYKLIVHNSAEVQSQVRRYIERVRILQSVEIAVECRLVKIDDRLRKTLATHHEKRSNGGNFVLSPNENAELLKVAAKADALRIPKVTLFSGQRIVLSCDAGSAWRTAMLSFVSRPQGAPPARNDRADGEKEKGDTARMVMSAFVGGNLRLIRLSVKSEFGKAEFLHNVELQDGETLACFETSGARDFLLQVTPRVIINLDTDEQEFPLAPVK